jgi:hypothetical protein
MSGIEQAFVILECLEVGRTETFAHVPRNRSLPDPELPVTNVCYAEVQRPVWAAVLEKHLGDMTYVEALGTWVP